MPMGLACCAIELMAAGASRFDISRFGAEVMRFSPGRSDVMIVAGTVTYKMALAVKRIYDQMPEPKVGASPWARAPRRGGMYRSYAVLQGIDQPLPVDVYIAGCPPRPEALARRPDPPAVARSPGNRSPIGLEKRLAQQGQDGEFRTRYKVVEENGAEVSREMTDAWVTAEPVTHMNAYGRKLVSKPLDTPEGPVTYWRKMRMYATSYSPKRSGTPKSAPWYGRTRLGLPLRKGIVAVDTSVIPLQEQGLHPRLRDRDCRRHRRRCARQVD